MFNLSNFLKVSSPFSILQRGVKNLKHTMKYPGNQGKYVNGTLYYYPRDKKEADPEITPAKLFRVHRVKPIRGNPYWERRILREFGLMDYKIKVAIVKNIPENNARLWKVKHLVKIEPINFPNGEPTAADLDHTFLKENGDCIVIKDINSFKDRLEAAEKKDKNEMEPETLRKNSRLKWLHGWE